MSSSGGVCIVTGANAGIGKEVTAGLMQEGHHVIMACRNMQRCEQARTELQLQPLSGSCECMKMDLGDFASVRAFANGALQRLQAQHKKIQVLVNNAGVIGLPVKDGMDAQLRINHFGPFLLTKLLLPGLAQNARIVNVSSRAHKQGSLRIERNKLVGMPSHWFMQYARSKLCNVLHVLELHRRLSADERCITSYAVSPGRVRTQIFDNLPPVARTLLAPIVWAFFQTPQQGASTVLYAALSPELEGRNVLYLHGCKEAQASKLGQDRALAQQLWLASEQAVGEEGRASPQTQEQHELG